MNSTLSFTSTGPAAPESSNGYSEECSVFPVSFAQQRLWFLHQFDPDSPVYNIASPTRLQGDLNVDALRHAIHEIARRHESLRTAFTTVDGKPMQVIAPHVSFEMPLIDLSGLPHEQRESEADRLLKADMKKPFDLRRSAFRVQLLRLSATEHLLSLNMHHIISDGWSMTVFFHELASLYENFCSDQPSSLPDLAIQYVDFAAWQRSWIDGEVLAGHLDYWKTKLAGAPALLEIPSDRPRPAVRSPRGALVTFSISKSLAESLRTLSRREGCSLFMTLLAAFKTMVARYTGEDDIVIGAPIGIRDKPELENMIGCFINTLVLRTDLSGNPSFRELLGRVRDTALEAYEHHETPLERIVEELKVPRHPGRSPIFQVLFQYLAEPAKLLEFGGVTGETLPIETETAQFELSLNLDDSADGLLGTFEYSTELFDAASIQRMTGHFLTLLEGIVRNPMQKIRSLPLLKPEEQDCFGRDAQHVDAANKTVPALFEQQAKKTPEAIAVILKEKQLTYRELNDRSNQLAVYLSNAGVGVETLVAVCMERSIEMIVAVLGILKAGGAYVPLDPNYPKDRMAFMLEDTGAPILLTQTHLAKMFSAEQTRIICVDSEWENITNESGSRVPLPAIRGENLAYIIYTSGSTGRPKGVMISHGSLCNHASWMQETFPLNAQDRVLQRAPFSFDVSVWEIFGPLLHGAQLVLFPPEHHCDTTALARNLFEHNITILQVVPSQLRVLLDEPKFKQCTALKYVLAGGEVLPPDLIPRFMSVSRAKLFNSYGPTETTIDATWYACSPEDSKRTNIPIGKTVINTHAYVLDSYLERVPINVPGELHLGGQGLARGYWRRDELTAEKFIANPFSREPGARLYKTGDRVRRLADGSIEFLGRLDHQVKIRGFRIELGEIETALCAFADVREAVVVARDNDAGGKRLVAYLVAPGIAANVSSELRAHLKTKLPDYMVPATFVMLPSLPLTPNGKIDLKSLPDPEFKTDDKLVERPRTPKEEQLAKIWSDVLGVQQIGIHDNFFELGGHSLLATQVVARMRALAGKDVTVRELFQSPTVAGLGEILASGEQPSVDTGAELIRALPRKKMVERVRNAVHVIAFSLQSFLPAECFAESPLVSLLIL